MTAYDAYRITAEALLAQQGLRATDGPGSHAVVEDAVSAQFDAQVPAFAKPIFERFRRSRNAAQYFDPEAPPISVDDAMWALTKAGDAISASKELLESEDLTQLLGE